MSNKNSLTEVAELLTPGSVWLREDGSKSILICVTNTSLPKKAAARFPAQAVYLDEAGDVFNRSIEDFLESRTFHNVQPDVERLVESLLAFREPQDDSDELIELADDELDDGDEEAPVEASNVRQFPGIKRNSALVALISDSLDPVTVEAIERAVVSYRQEPMFEEGIAVAHVITVDMAALGFNIDDLSACFNPVSSEDGLIDLIRPRGVEADIEWTTYIGTYYQLTGDKVYATIWLGEEEVADDTDDLEREIAALSGVVQQDSAEQAGDVVAEPMPEQDAAGNVGVAPAADTGTGEAAAAPEANDPSKPPLVEISVG